VVDHRWPSLCAIVLSVILGALVAVAGLSSRKSLNRASRVYVEVFRSIPCWC
jgi:ABC-type amino acid transport system permease subunit